MREIRSSGSVRGVRSDPYPYRDMVIPVQSTVSLSISALTANLDGRRPTRGRHADEAVLQRWHDLCESPMQEASLGRRLR